MSDKPTAEQVRAIHERRERAERHVFFAMATIFGVLALVAWRHQSGDSVDTAIILVLVGFWVGGVVVWAVGTFLALLAAFYERRDKKHEG